MERKCGFKVSRELIGVLLASGVLGIGEIVLMKGNRDEIMGFCGEWCCGDGEMFR